jgi:hypothetical protein
VGSDDVSDFDAVKRDDTGFGIFVFLYGFAGSIERTIETQK